MTLQPSLLEQIKEGQSSDEYLIELKYEILSGKKVDFQLSEDGVIRFRSQLCVLDNAEIGRIILRETHSSTYSIHPSTTKIYNDLKPYYWWPGMKKNVVKFLKQCLTC